MPATVREVVSGSAYAGTTSSKTVTTGSATAVGDLLVAVVGADYVNNGAALPTPTGTAGTWSPRTVITNDSNLAGRAALGIFTRPVTVAGAQTVTAALAAIGDTAVFLAVYVVADPDPTTPVLGGSSVYGDGTGTTSVAPAVTGDVGAVLLCGWQSTYNTGTTAANGGYTPPVPPMTGAFTTPVADGATLDSAREALSAAGSTGTRAAPRRHSTTRSWRAAAIAIAGVAAGGGTPPGGTTTLVEDFEDENFVVTVSGNGRWATTADRAQTGTRSVHNITIADGVTADLTLTAPVDATAVRFWYSVSSESGYDFFRFLLAGVQQFQASGEVAWTQSTTYPLTGGEVLTFRYIKDSSAVAGLDAAFVDNVEFTVPAPVGPEPGRFLLAAS